MKIIKKIFCLHFYEKTGITLGSQIIQWKCNKCGKIIYKEHFERPINYINNE